MPNLARHETAYPQMPCNGVLVMWVEPNALRSYQWTDWIVQRCTKCRAIVEVYPVLEEIRYL